MTGSNDPLIFAVTTLACVVLGAYLAIKNHRRKP